MSTTRAAVRRVVLGWPEVTEEPHFEMSSWRVRGRIFATVPPQRHRLRVMLDEDVARDVVARLAPAVEELRWGKRLAGVAVHLDELPREEVIDVLEAGWRRRAPKALLAALDNAAGRRDVGR